MPPLPSGPQRGSSASSPAASLRTTPPAARRSGLQPSPDVADGVWQALDSALAGGRIGAAPRPENARILLANVLQSSSRTFSCVSFPSVFAFKEGMWDTPISALGGSPTVSGGFVSQKQGKQSQG